MSTVIDVDARRVLGVVDGRGIRAQLRARPSTWLPGIEIVGIDPSAAFRKTLREHLPNAAVSVDRFHLVKLANDMLTKVRRRVAQEQHGRRGGKEDRVWAHRQLLLRGYDTLSERGRSTLQEVLDRDDPTDEISVAGGVKEGVRLMLKTTAIEDLPATREFFSRQVLAADMPETTGLWATINKWWPEIETLIRTRATTAKV